MQWKSHDSVLGVARERGWWLEVTGGKLLVVGCEGDAGTTARNNFKYSYFLQKQDQPYFIVGTEGFR